MGKGLEMAEEGKLFVLTCAIISCSLITFYAGFVLHTTILYIHLYYIPILLAGIWYQRKAVYLALGLGVLYILVVNFSQTLLTEIEFVKAAIFLAVAYAVGYVSEKEAKKGRELYESEERLSQIVHGSSTPTFVIDNRHAITHWNKACERLTGLSADEIVGTKKLWEAFYSGERYVMADFIVDGQSEEEIAEYYKGKYEKSALMEGAYEAVDFFPSLGEEGKWLIFTAAPLRDSKGAICGAIETLQDLTELKKADEELKQTTRSLQEHVEKLKDSKTKLAEAYRLRETFLKETSHRIITPVAIIGGYTELLLESNNLDYEQVESIQIIRERNVEIQELVRDALLGRYSESG